MTVFGNYIPFGAELKCSNYVGGKTIFFQDLCSRFDKTRRPIFLVKAFVLTVFFTLGSLATTFEIDSVEMNPNQHTLIGEVEPHLLANFTTITT